MKKLLARVSYSSWLLLVQPTAIGSNIWKNIGRTLASEIPSANSSLVGAGLQKLGWI